MLTIDVKKNNCENCPWAQADIESGGTSVKLWFTGEKKTTPTTTTTQLQRLFAKENGKRSGKIVAARRRINKIMIYETIWLDKRT